MSPSLTRTTALALVIALGGACGSTRQAPNEARIAAVRPIERVPPAAVFVARIDVEALLATPWIERVRGALGVPSRDELPPEERVWFDMLHATDTLVVTLAPASHPQPSAGSGGADRLSLLVIARGQYAPFAAEPVLAGVAQPEPHRSGRCAEGDPGCSHGDHVATLLDAGTLLFGAPGLVDRERRRSHPATPGPDSSELRDALRRAQSGSHTFSVAQVSTSAMPIEFLPGQPPHRALGAYADVGDGLLGRGFVTFAGPESARAHHQAGLAALEEMSQATAEADVGAGLADSFRLTSSASDVVLDADLSPGHVELVIALLFSYWLPEAGAEEAATAPE